MLRLALSIAGTDPFTTLGGEPLPGSDHLVLKKARVIGASGELAEDFEHVAALVDRHVPDALRQGIEPGAVRRPRR